MGVPGLPASLLSLEYEEKDHGSRGDAKAEDDQEHFFAEERRKQMVEKGHWQM